MDIVTHGMMGAILGSALLESAPLTGVAFALGNVLPDLDAFSRCFGKRAFMKVHQSHTHGYAAAAVCGVGLDLALRFGAPGWHEPTAGLGLAFGMALHSTLDYTNTYGITLWAPFSNERRSTEWVFFIDAVVITLGVVALMALGWRQHTTGSFGWQAQAAYAGLLSVYWAFKAWLRTRAGWLAPEGTLSLLPSALVPWWFLGAAREGDQIRVFRLDARSGACSHEERISILDDDYREALDTVREYHVMQTLSPAYHVVEAAPVEEGTRLRCRDLRTRNFGTSFGELELLLDAQGAVKEVEFHV
jgi:membrane-bound metal-dependent hydrolase YbcI (DUF457 family)